MVSPINLSISLRCNNNFRVHVGSWLNRFPCSYGAICIFINCASPLMIRQCASFKLTLPARIDLISVPFKTIRSEEHTSELQSRGHIVCRLLLDPFTSVFFCLSLHDALPIFSSMQ